MIVQMRFGLDNLEGKEKTQKEVADILGNFAVLYFAIGEENHAEVKT